MFDDVHSGWIDVSLNVDAITAIKKYIEENPVFAHNAFALCKLKVRQPFAHRISDTHRSLNEVV